VFIKECLKFIHLELVCVCVMDMYIMYIDRNHVPPGGWTLL